MKRRKIKSNMGNTTSAAKEKAGETSDELNQMLTVLQNKLAAMELAMQKTRGDATSVSQTEVAGGRTVMRVSEIRVATDSSVDDQITDALTDFFDAAQGAIDGNSQAAKHSAVQGAQNLLSAGINALLGVQSGQGMEKQSFVVLFLNNSFVRVDYYMYAYSISTQAWGKQANKSGLCYITDLAVLDMSTLTPSEIDFLTSQALAISQGAFDKLMEVKIRLIEVSILSNALKNPQLSFKDLQTITEQLGETQKAISSAFSSLQSQAEYRQAQLVARESNTNNNVNNNNADSNNAANSNANNNNINNNNIISNNNKKKIVNKNKTIDDDNDDKKL